LPGTITKGFELKNMNFFYRLYEKNVINCVNFSIELGEIVALVGGNGSCKSTIVKLWTMLYDPRGGDYLSGWGKYAMLFNTQAKAYM